MPRCVPFALAVIVIGLAACACAPTPPSPTTPRASPEPIVGLRDLAALAVPPSGPEPSTLDPKEVREDVGLLAYALERAYAGALPEAGNIAAPVIAHLRARFLGDQLLWKNEFCQQLDSVLSEAPDGHLVARLGRVRCVELERPPIHVGSNVVASGSWSYEERAVGPRRIGVFGFASFPHADRAVWRELDASIERARNTDAIVVDLRGNGGGDPERGLVLARRLVDAKNPAGWARILSRETPEVSVLAQNTLLDMIRLERTDDGRDALARRLKNVRWQLEGSSKGRELRVTELDASPAPGPAHFDGPIEVLVDGGCESACESVLLALKRHPRARSLGAPTAGACRFGDVVRLTLPHSRVTVTIPTEVYVLNEGEFAERRGFTPDRVLPEGSDALAVALDEVR